MAGALRVVIGGSAAAAAEVAAILSEPALGPCQISREEPGAAAAIARYGQCDLLVLACVPAAELRAAIARVDDAVPVAIVADAIDDDVAAIAMRWGAPACLLAHGAAPLAAAIERARAPRGGAELRAMFDAAPVGLAQLDASGRIERANHALESLLGRTRDQLCGLSLSDLEPHRPPATVADLQRTLVDRAGEHRQLATRYARSDGSAVDVLESVIAGRHAAFAFVEDASGRAAMEAAVRASESVRALVYVSVADVVFRLRVEGDRFRFLEINPAFTRATGLSEPEVIGRCVDEVIPEPSLSLVLAKYREAIRERRTVRWEEVTAYPTGQKVGEVSVTPLVDADGTVRNLVGTVHDVTEIRRREEEVRLYADVVRSVQIGVTVWSVGDPGDPRTVVLTAFNPQAQRMTGIDLGGRIGHRLIDVLPAMQGTEILDLVCDVAREGGTREIREHRFLDAPTARVHLVKGFPLPGRNVGLALEDVTVEARARAMSVLEQRVLEMVAAGEPLGATLEALVLAIEREVPPAIGSVLLMAPDGKHVRHGAAPHLPEEYNRAVDGSAIGPTAGSCGTAAYLRRSVIVTDIETDALWASYRDLARGARLRACWSMPILAPDGRVLGTFAVYYREPRAPSVEELELIARATHVAGLAIQRHELDEQLRGLAARIEAVREEERTAIARDVHDELGQTLTALKMDLGWVARRASSPQGLSREALLERVQQLSETTDGLIGEVRRIASELRPGILDDLGLEAAVSWQADEFTRRTGVPVHCAGEIGEEPLERSLATTVFRVFQESLTNVARHAGATRVDVRLAREDGFLVLEVRDDGSGIRAEDVHDARSLGLVGIRERARRAGGTAAFERAEPSGTIVRLRLPLAAAPGASGSGRTPSS